ncbi:(2Fe-2S) ferredoxin domain-containing protein [Plasticicumulans acidivorans]|uniref:(2Fe-2S) ferredoxin n=1 Tax=Plasticicumulans acidivorans TaxID=886464 RepID=A0A317MYD3_9GAMM|nr:ferredoxin [Plasticicumulans acidivorans]PWV64633.1 (2Fe-2S) ferredoxin [Plasticicumulans acidivorans]
MSHYRHHVFFCTNERAPDAGRQSCGPCGAMAALEHAKARVQALGLTGAGKVRVNKSGCLDRCELGPLLVVYPEAVWYTYVDNDDIDEIIDEHLVNGRIVERLRLPD